MPDPHQITADILTGPHQIPRRLLLGIGQAYFHDLIQPQQPAQMFGILGVGFDPIPRRPGQFRWRRHRTHDPAAAEKPGQPVAGRPRLIGHLHRLRQRLQPAPNPRRIRRQSLLPHLAGVLIQCMPDHRPGVHIQPDERTLSKH